MLIASRGKHNMFLLLPDGFNGGTHSQSVRILGIHALIIGPVLKVMANVLRKLV